VNQSLGEIAYNKIRESLLSGPVVRSIPMFFQLSAEERIAYEEGASAVAAAVPPKEVMPEVYLDCTPREFETSYHPTSDSHEVKLSVWVPAIVAKHAKPGDAMNMLGEIQNSFKRFDRKIRISTVSDSEIQAELSRLNRDGTIREFVENEGTW
jgi:hypothetical protein